MTAEKLSHLTARFSFAGPFWAAVVLFDMSVLKAEHHAEGFSWLLMSAGVVILCSLISGLASIGSGWTSPGTHRRLAFVCVLLNAAILMLVFFLGTATTSPFIYAM